MSVVIPVRNGASTLAAQLDALARATPPTTTFEVVIADNGSTDSTAETAHSYVDRLPVRVVDAGRRPGINVARNEGVKASTAEWIILCDADDEVDTGWLVGMEQCFDAGHELVLGRIDYVRLNAPEVRAWRGAHSAGAYQPLGFLTSGHGANIGFTRALHEAIGGFDEDFAGGGDDTDFCWRAQIAGFQPHVQEDLVVHYRLRPSLRAHWRQSVNYGASEARLYRKFAAQGLRRRPATAPLRELWWLVTRVPIAWPIGRRGAWLRKCGAQWGRVRGAVQARTLWW